MRAGSVAFKKVEPLPIFGAGDSAHQFAAKAILDRNVFRIGDEVGVLVALTLLSAVQ